MTNPQGHAPSGGYALFFWSITMTASTLNYLGIENPKLFLFEPGHVVRTANLNAWAEKNLPDVLISDDRWARILINAHLCGCWDELSDFDRETNQAAIRDEGNVDEQCRVFSVFNINGEKVYVITEYDRSITTLLLASDY